MKISLSCPPYLKLLLYKKKKVKYSNDTLASCKTCKYVIYREENLKNFYMKQVLDWQLIAYTLLCGNQTRSLVQGKGITARYIDIIYFNHFL